MAGSKTDVPITDDLPDDVELEDQEEDAEDVGSDIAPAPVQLEGMRLRRGRVVPPIPAASSSRQVPVSSHSGPAVESFITVDTLADALRQSRSGEPDLTKGKVPEWNTKTEDFVAYEQKVELWIGQYGMSHLLRAPPTASEERIHSKARAQILMTLPPADRTTVFRMSHLCEAWEYLKSKYRPSTEAEIHRLWSRFNSLSQGNRDVGSYCGEVMSVYTQLEALGADVGMRWLRLKLLEVGEEFNTVRGELLYANPHVIIGRLTEHADLLKYQRMQAGSGMPAGKPGQGWRNRGGGKGGPPGVAIVGINQDPREETRTCFFCKKKGHIRANCPQRKHAGKGKDKAVLAVEVPSFWPACALEAWNVVIDSGADISVVGNRAMFTEYGPCRFTASPAGKGALPILGKGTIVICLGTYVDVHGNKHPLDIEISDVYYAPECPYNLLSTSHLRDEGIFLDTRRNVVSVS